MTGSGVGGGVGFFSLSSLADLSLSLSFELSGMADDSPELYNTELIYKYTQDSVDKLEKNVDVVTSRLTTLLGFNGVLIKFAAEMSSVGPLILFKITTITLIAVAIGLCITGLKPVGTGKTLISPADLLRDEPYAMSGEAIRVYIVRAWIDYMSGLMKIRTQRTRLFNNAITLVAIAGMVFAFHSAIESTFFTAPAP